MTSLDLAGHLGYLAVFLGLVAIGRGRWWGWALRGVGEAIWIGIGYQLGLTSIVIWGLLFAGCDAYNLGQWLYAEGV